MSQNQPFRENYNGTGKWAVLAAWMNRVGRLLNNLRAGQGVDIEPNVAGGFDISAPGRTTKGGGEIPPPPGGTGIWMLYVRRYGEDGAPQYAWTQPPASASRLGYIPSFVDCYDIEGDRYLEVVWIDAGRIELLPES